MKRVADITRDVAVIVRKIEGSCAAGIKIGDKIVIRGANVSLSETDTICAYAFSSLMPVIFAVRLGVNFGELGIQGRLWQCVDPGPPHTPGGTVFFEVLPYEEAKP